VEHFLTRLNLQISHPQLIFHQLASSNQVLQVYSEPWFSLPIWNIATDDLPVTQWTEPLMVRTRAETPTTSQQIY
jgi:hypothetical protein